MADEIMQHVIKMKICRLCLSCSYELENIHYFTDSVNGIQSLSASIYGLFGIEVRKDDSLSQLVCLKCLRVITLISRYRLRFRENDRILRKKMNEGATNTTTALTMETKDTPLKKMEGIANLMLKNMLEVPTAANNTPSEIVLQEFSSEKIVDVATVTKEKPLKEMKNVASRTNKKPWKKMVNVVITKNKKMVDVATIIKEVALKKTVGVPIISRVKPTKEVNTTVVKEIPLKKTVDIPTIMGVKPPKKIDEDTTATKGKLLKKNIEIATVTKKNPPNKPEDASTVVKETLPKKVKTISVQKSAKQVQENTTVTKEKPRKKNILSSEQQDGQEQPPKLSTFDSLPNAKSIYDHPPSLRPFIENERHESLPLTTAAKEKTIKKVQPATEKPKKTHWKQLKRKYMKLYEDDAEYKVIGKISFGPNVPTREFRYRQPQLVHLKTNFEPMDPTSSSSTMLQPAEIKSEPDDRIPFKKCRIAKELQNVNLAASISLNKLNEVELNKLSDIYRFSKGSERNIRTFVQFYDRDETPSVTERALFEEPIEEVIEEFEMQKEGIVYSRTQWENFETILNGDKPDAEVATPESLLLSESRNRQVLICAVCNQIFDTKKLLNLHDRYTHRKRVFKLKKFNSNAVRGKNGFRMTSANVNKTNVNV